MKIVFTLLLFFSFQSLWAQSQNSNGSTGSVKNLKPVQGTPVDPKGNPIPVNTNPQEPAVSQPTLPAPSGKSNLKFEQTTYDFGKIKQGEVVNYTFKFTNTSTQNITLDNVRASCGCTTPNYSKEAIKPGETGKIDVKFDSNGKSGPQSKTVTVKTSETDNNMIILNIKGEIVMPAAPAQPAGGQ